MLAHEPGFSLHAPSVCEAHPRDRPERLGSYISRPAVANERISVVQNGQVFCRFKLPYRDGTTVTFLCRNLLGVNRNETVVNWKMPFSYL